MLQGLSEEKHSIGLSAAASYGVFAALIWFVARTRRKEWIT